MFTTQVYTISHFNHCHASIHPSLHRLLADWKLTFLNRLQHATSHSHEEQVNCFPSEGLCLWLVSSLPRARALWLKPSVRAKRADSQCCIEISAFLSFCETRRRLAFVILLHLISLAKRTKMINNTQANLKTEDKMAKNTRCFEHILCLAFALSSLNRLFVKSRD